MPRLKTHGKRRLGPLRQNELLGVKKRRKPWKPLPWQIEPFMDKENDIILLSGSAGGGKSHLFCEKIHQYCKTFPGSFNLAVRKTRESITSSTALVLERDIIRGEARHVKHESQFMYPNGSILKYTGMASAKERERIRSMGLKGGVDFIVVEEANALTEEDFDELQARLRGRAGTFRQIILATNPDSPKHWIYQRLIEGGEAKVYYSGAKDNPHVDDKYREMLNKLSGVYRERLALGKWVSAEGLVHSNWEESINIVEDYDILREVQENPDHWRLLGAIDFGFEHPCVVQWWAVERGKQPVMTLYREYYKTKVVAPDLADVILQHTTPFERQKIQWYADHQAGERAILAKKGIRTHKADKSVEKGLNIVNSMLRFDQELGGPRIRLFKDALIETDTKLKAKYQPVRTADEFSLYTWAKDPAGQPTDRPIKQFDHGMDATRYVAVAVEGEKQWVILN